MHIVDRCARAQLEREHVPGPPEIADHFEVDMAASDRLMIAALRADVVQVKTDCVRRQSLQMGAMLKQPHALLDVGVTGVVPVANGSTSRKSGEKLNIIVIDRELLELFAV